MADQYDRFRPAYPQALIDDVLSYAGMAPGSTALEVGAGTGKATSMFVRRGISVRAIEPSAEMAAYLRDRWPASTVTVEQADFEAWDPRGETFPLLYSAQAWHWIAPEVRFVKARSVLSAGGTLALFWNRPRWSECSLREQLDAVYRESAPDLPPHPGPMIPAGQEEPELWGDMAGELAAAGGFEQLEGRLYEHRYEYTAEEYTALLRTHSDHILLPEDQRDALMRAVAGVIDDAGGRLALSYLTKLCLARATGR